MNCVAFDGKVFNSGAELAAYEKMQCDNLIRECRFLDSKCNPQSVNSVDEYIEKMRKRSISFVYVPQAAHPEVFEDVLLSPFPIPISAGNFEYDFQDEEWYLM